VLQPGQGVGKVLDWAFSHFDLKTKKKLYAAFWREVVSRAEAEELSGKRKCGSFGALLLTKPEQKLQFFI
jgi:hypothetical protein